MEETAVLKLVFGILLTVFPLVLFLIAFRFFYRYTQEEKRCTSETAGTVVGYEWFNRGDAIHLPILNFTVIGKAYKIVGPKYRWIKTTKVGFPSLKTKQEYTTDIYALTFEHKITGNRMIIRNPMQELFPVGSTLPVFYDPNNPKLSYVLRSSKQAGMFWFTFITASVLVIINILIQIFI